MIVVKAFNKKSANRNGCTTWQWLAGWLAALNKVVHRNNCRT